MIYHVSKQGSDKNEGSEKQPFLTIQKAAGIAKAGDTVIVHEGVYREWVRPEYGGKNQNSRIIYQAADGEHVAIKGSEHITGWEMASGTVWKVVLPNEIFGNYNPYLDEIDGDWLVSPRKQKVHTGEVYMNGKSFYEAASLEEVMHPQMRTKSMHETWGNREEQILHPEDTVYQWFAVAEESVTTIYANFQGADPNREYVEINVRPACFFPEKTGLGYITVSGFELAQAATNWAPPTAQQKGLIGPNWSRGWVIENNCIHDAKCSAVCLGKEAFTGDNDFTEYGKKPGYQYQMEAVFLALASGWSKELIGSHLVRNNRIYDCGQNGIVGHMGCAFSEIYENEIFRIGTKHEFYGHEMGGIKFHAAIDTYIHHNYIHHCSLGTWIDWQAQGLRLSSNIYHGNNRDFMIEVTHGPYLVDNNIFTAEYALDNAAQGGAYVHNLFCGFMNHYPVWNRATPYHFPHSTQILGTVPVYGSDDRWFQNLFVGGKEDGKCYGTADYDGAPVSMEEYVLRVKSLGYGDIEMFEQIKQPAYIDGNVYLNGAKAFEREEHCYLGEEDPEVTIVNEEDGVYLELMLPEKMFGLHGKVITTKDLPVTRISEAAFEERDGSCLLLAEDLNGRNREGTAVAGPLQDIRGGKNRIKIWDS